MADQPAHPMRIVATWVVAALAATATADPVRIVTYNVESYNAPGSDSYAALVRIVDSLAPDILFIQEASNDAGRAAFETRYGSAYPYRLLGAADGGGNRQHIFSRWPLTNAAQIFAGGFSRPSLRADLDSDPENPGPELRLYNVHFKSGFESRDWELRAAMAQAIRADVQTLQAIRPDFRIVFAGDCNEQPGDSNLITLYYPQLPLRLLTKVDPFTGSPATRPSSGRNIDHFILSDTINARVLTRYIYSTGTYRPEPPPPALRGDSETASDHLAVVLEIDLVRFRVGDMNNDGAVDNFDIDPFVLALTNLPAYRQAYPWVDPLEVADVNGDGVINNFDIDAFVSLLVRP